MTITPSVSPPRPDGFAVIPVVEYEPPGQSLPRDVRPSSHGALRHRIPSIPRAAGRPPGRPPEAVAAAVMPASMREVAVFADAALRRVLEVIDRRRPLAQLRPLLAPSLVDSVQSVGQSEHEGAAVLRRLRLQPAGHPDPAAAAEVFGSYSRGERVHAIACRVERMPGPRWLVVALHIG
ncbi:Rv3235 family protein [Mycobacterium sp.]|uniref:Rv3235 family protein n=1 Tax=Mycobacterium sp. TaxID=1785 RepID=UPI002BA16C8D|nr:Rv3235 family protein [Mycobacterium sp.]HTQ19885.1 Rv3235 family protein [Mycobacterium sp.]